MFYTRNMAKGSVRPQWPLPNSNLATWLPVGITSLPLSGPDDADPRDGIEVFMLHDNRSIERTSINDRRMIAYRVTGAASIEQAIDAPGIPAIGSVHPFNHALIARRQKIRVLGYSSYVVEVEWDYPNTGELSGFDSKLRFSIGNVNERREVDLNGYEIGSRVFVDGSTYTGTGELDENVEIGLDALKNDIQFEVESPRPSEFDLAADSAFWLRVNSSPFLGFAAGYCQYLGPNAEWIGPNPDDWAVVRRFRAGELAIPPRFQGDAGGPYLGLEWGVWFLFEKQSDGSRKAVKLKKAKLYQSADLNALLI